MKKFPRRRLFWFVNSGEERDEEKIIAFMELSGSAENFVTEHIVCRSIAGKIFSRISSIMLFLF